MPWSCEGSMLIIGECQGQEAGVGRLGSRGKGGMDRGFSEGKTRERDNI